MVGSGIFVLPALVAADLGAAAIPAYLVCGALIFSIGLCFAELGSGTAKSGGLYTYIEEAFGPFAGFLASNIYWLGGAVMADAAISNALADILAGFFPALSTGAWRVLFTVLLFAALALLNISGVKRGLRFVESTMLGKVVPLIMLVLLAVRFVEPANLQWTGTLGTGSVGAASLLLFYAFLGLETPLINGGEIKDQQRTVPRGLLVGLLLVLALYIGIQLVSKGVLGADLAAHNASPLGGVAGIILGPVGVVTVVLVTFVSMSGCMGGNMLSVPRILYAAGRNGALPQVLGGVHPRFSTPYIAIAVYAAIGCTMALTGSFRQLAILSSASVLLIYLGVVLAVLKSRLQQRPALPGVFRAPGGPFLPVAAACGIGWLLSNLSGKEFLWFGVFIALLSAAYVLVGVRTRRRMGKVVAD